MTERGYKPRQKPAPAPKPEQASGGLLSDIFGTVADVGREAKRIASSIGWVFAGAAFVIGLSVHSFFKKKEGPEP